MKFILGIIGIAIGVGMLKYTNIVRSWIGSIGWAEKWFGAGGTDTGLRLIAVGIMILSFMYMTGTIEFFITNTIGKLVVPGGI